LPLGLDTIRDYPWINFRLDLRDCLPRFWMLVGEARSKCEHIRYVPLQKDVAERMHYLEFARGVLATTAIEGNTLSLEQVQARMEGTLQLPPSQEYLGIEVDNMLAAYNSIKDRLWNREQLLIEPAILKELNKQILAGLDLPAGIVPGEFRTRRVAVGPYLAPEASDVEELISQLCVWLGGPTFVAPEDDQRIPYAFIKAVVAHLYLEWIHPFGDGNGRLGRLIEFQVLLSSGVPAPAAHLLTQHYMATRSEYYRQLANASAIRDLRPFLLYAAQGWVDHLSEQIKLLHSQAEVLMWRALVDESFGERPSPPEHRQKLIAIALVSEKGSAPRAKIRSLSESIAEAYAGKGPKTLTRDLNRLVGLGMITEDSIGYRANVSLVRGMRPFATSERTSAT
jgi:Fic family protein